CFATAGLGDCVTDTLFGIDVAFAATGLMSVEPTPPASVAVSATWCTPPAVKVCRTICPTAVPPSPKFHVKVQVLHGRPSSVTPVVAHVVAGWHDASNVTDSPMSGVALLMTKSVITGGAL